MEIYFLIAVIWVVCGYIAFGYIFGYFQEEYPKGYTANDWRNGNLRFSMGVALCGPSGLLAVTLGYYAHGRRYPWEQAR